MQVVVCEVALEDFEFGARFLEDRRPTQAESLVVVEYQTPKLGAVGEQESGEVFREEFAAGYDLKMVEILGNQREKGAVDDTAGFEDEVLKVW